MNMTDRLKRFPRKENNVLLSDKVLNNVRGGVRKESDEGVIQGQGWIFVLCRHRVWIMVIVTSQEPFNLLSHLPNLRPPFRFFSIGAT